MMQDAFRTWIYQDRHAVCRAAQFSLRALLQQGQEECQIATKQKTATRRTCSVQPAAAMTRHSVEARAPKAILSLRTCSPYFADFRLSMPLGFPLGLPSE